MSASHCQRILAVLSDGKPHTTSDLYRQCGGMILHSRIAELRRRGHRIECEHVGGRGPHAYAYTLTEAAR